MKHPMCEVSGGRPAVIEYVCLSERGAARSENEDSCVVITPEQHGIPEKGTLLIVADGMGGLEAGGQASRLIAAELPRLYLTSTIPEPVGALVQAVHDVHRRVYEARRSMGSDKLMGSTVVAAVILHSVVVTVNVGDSRAYLCEKGRLRQLTVDHTLSGNFFFPHARRPDRLSHVLVQAIGTQPVLSPHIAMTAMAGGDLLLLCSDGLTSVVSDAEIEQIIAAEPFDALPGALQRAIVQKNGEDDVSIIVSRLAAFSEDELCS